MAARYHGDIAHVFCLAIFYSNDIYIVGEAGIGDHDKIPVAGSGMQFKTTIVFGTGESLHYGISRMYQCYRRMWQVHLVQCVLDLTLYNTLLRIRKIGAKYKE